MGAYSVVGHICFKITLLNWKKKKKKKKKKKALFPLKCVALAPFLIKYVKSVSKRKNSKRKQPMTKQL